jgi:hypothetical protein
MKDETAVQRRRTMGDGDGSPRLFAPREVVILEQLLRALRQELAYTSGAYPLESLGKIVINHRESLGELHAFVRGMIYGL